MAKKDKKQVLVFKQFTVKQFISLIIGILFFLTGIGLLITYFVGDNLDIRGVAYKLYQNALTQFNAFTHTSIGFIGWGIITLLFGALVITLVLSLSSKIEDREKDRKARRELRLQALKEENKEAKLVEEVISTLNNENK